MQPSRCTGILLACLLFPTLSWAEAVYVPRLDPESDYLDAIDRVEAVSGAYSTELADLYLGLGQSLLEHEKYEDAIKALHQGALIVRVNFGLNSPDQTHYLFSIADIEGRLGNWKSAKRVMQYVYLINSRSYGENDPRMLPMLSEMLNWYLNHLTLQSSVDSYSDFKESEFLASKMALIIEQEKGLGHSDTAASYRTIGQIHWFTAKYLLEQGIPLEPMINSFARTVQSGVNALEVSVRNHFRGGRDAFAKVVQSVSHKQDRTPLEHAEAIAQLGDWNLVFGKSQSAGKTYQQAYNLLADSEDSKHLADTYFGEPTPIRFLINNNQPDLKKIELDNDAGKKIEISMTVTRGGRLLNIELLNPPENMSKDQLRQISKKIRQMQFRPRLSNGLPEKTKEFIWHYPITQAEGLP